MRGRATPALFANRRHESTYGLRMSGVEREAKLHRPLQQSGHTFEQFPTQLDD